MKKLIISIFVLLIVSLSSTSAFAESVIFNWKTLKYHKPSCQWAKKCTVNCTKVDKKEAIKNGGRPCKVCGG